MLQSIMSPVVSLAKFTTGISNFSRACANPFRSPSGYEVSTRGTQLIVKPKEIPGVLSRLKTNLLGSAGELTIGAVKLTVLSGMTQGALCDFGLLPVDSRFSEINHTLYKTTLSVASTAKDLLYPVARNIGETIGGHIMADPASYAAMSGAAFLIYSASEDLDTMMKSPTYFINQKVEFDPSGENKPIFKIDRDIIGTDPDCMHLSQKITLGAKALVKSVLAVGLVAGTIMYNTNDMNKSINNTLCGKDVCIWGKKL